VLISLEWPAELELPYQPHPLVAAHPPRPARGRMTSRPACRWARWRA